MTPEASVPTISGGSVDKKPLDSVDLKMGPGLAGKEAEAAASAKPLPPWSERYPAKAKAVYWTFVQNSSKIYESTPSKTMKYIAVGSAILIFLGALTLVLAQKDESVPNKYGMAFPLDDASSVRSEKRTMFGIPGEGSLPTQAPVVEETTMTEVVTETPTTVKSDVFEAKDVPVQEPTEGGPAVMVAGDEDEKVDDNDQRIVFIERLMGLHLSGPAGQDGEQVNSQDNVHDPKKVNAKWATRTRKFSFPIPPQEAQPAQAIPSAEQPHPMLRYAAAAMMSRLIAAAARSQMEAQSREALMMRGGAKDKDDDSEDESVPVLLATVREDEPSIQDIRSRPMYGRPMPRQLGGRPQPPPSVMQRTQHGLHGSPHHGRPT
ncbi:hypothetical protein HDE_10711 [Halotydeus destructor]|nr:hypothetical protein HDE_10711 [Halotydeus destructor]